MPSNFQRSLYEASERLGGFNQTEPRRARRRIGGQYGLSSVAIDDENRWY
jgi:hypothetical protein